MDLYEDDTFDLDDEGADIPEAAETTPDILPFSRTVADETAAERDAAALEREKLMTDPDKPYFDPGWKRAHPREWQAIHERICQLSQDAVSARDRLSPIARAGVDVVDEQTVHQNDLRSQAEQAMAACVEEGFSQSDIPGDITAVEIVGLQAQALAARGARDPSAFQTFDHLLVEAERHMPRTTPAARHVMELKEQYASAENPADKSAIGIRLAAVMAKEILRVKHGIIRNR